MMFTERPPFDQGLQGRARAADTTGMTDAPCPRCRTALQRTPTAAGLRYICPACLGAVIGLAVFRQTLPDGAGSRMWLASEQAPENGPPCAFCGRPMRPAAVPSSAGDPAMVGVCRPCEAVWVPADQTARLPVRPDLAIAGAIGLTAGSAPPPARCPECGAPYEVTADDCCPYCHRRVEVPPPVVIFEPAADPGDLGSLDVGVAASKALRFLLGR